jgi:hypothetical protein
VECSVPSPQQWETGFATATNRERINDPHVGYQSFFGIELHNIGHGKVVAHGWTTEHVRVSTRQDTIDAVSTTTGH